jgi:hypothetical protein
MAVTEAKPGRTIASATRRAPTGALAAGAAAAGLAGGLMLGARATPRRGVLKVRRRKVLGVPVGRRSTAAIVAGRVVTTAGKASKAVNDIHAIREQLEQVNRRSPVEILLDGLTHRRGAHKLET